jgi:hypothetical protein
MPLKLQHIVPLFGNEDPYTSDTSEAEPRDDEVSDSEFVELEDREWTDEQLKDDGRPGRRVGKIERVTELKDSMREAKKLLETMIKKKTTHKSWEVGKYGRLHPVQEHATDLSFW